MFFFKNSSSANYEKNFYDFKINSIDGKVINFNDFKGKVVLLVNTASYCGFTKQYNDLQKLWDKYRTKGLIVLAIPSNSFNQEKNNDDDVKQFCEINFNITFPISTITDVKGDKSHEMFQWAKKKYGKSAVPKWNFHKLLINRNGIIVETYSSFTKPTSKKITNNIEKLLN